MAVTTGKTKASSKQPSYGADSLRELSGLEPIRQSPAEYIGDTSAVSVKNGVGHEEDGEVLTGGGMHLFKEILGNSSDEATNVDEDGNPHATRIDIILGHDQSITVMDNGRGVPPDVNKATGKTGIEMCYLAMNSGGKFKDREDPKSGSYKTAQGLHGVGGACVAALSDRLDVTVWRNDSQYDMSVRCGIPGRFDGDEIRSKFTPSDRDIVSVSPDKRSKSEKSAFPHGTKVRWHPDPTIWGGTDIPLHDLYEYVNAQSYMAPSCTYNIVDDTGSKRKETSFHHPGGINDMVEEKTSSGNNVSPVISFDVPSSYVKSIIVDDDNGTQRSEDIEYGCDVKVSLCWTPSSGSDIEGYANGVHCSGKHVDGFRRGISRGVGDWLVSSNTNIMKKTDPQPNIDDITDGLVAVIEVLLDEQCSFTSQTKEILNNQEVLSCVSDTVKEQMTSWLTSRKNSAASKRIGKSVMDSARLRQKQKKERDAAKKIKAKLGVSSKPSKLFDCRNEGPGTELLICEGDSAGGTIKLARDASWQAVFPVRGVSLNSYGAKADKILANQEFADMVNAMRGGGIGKHFDIDNRRYDRIGIYTDADEDGNYIRGLLLVFIYTCFPGMIEAGKVFAGCPPLYSVKYTKGSKKGDVIYLMDEAERDSFVEKSQKSGDSLDSMKISRQKGLGESDADEFRLCLNPDTRKVRVITLSDLDGTRDDADNALEMLFGKSDEDKVTRRTWIDDTFESEVE